MHGRRAFPAPVREQHVALGYTPARRVDGRLQRDVVAPRRPLCPEESEGLYLMRRINDALGVNRERLRLQGTSV